MEFEKFKLKDWYEHSITLNGQVFFMTSGGGGAGGEELELDLEVYTR
jgi:hypothetical protein